MEYISHEAVYVLNAFTTPENVGLHFTCLSTTPYEFTQLVLIIIYFLKKWWESISVCTLWNERLLHQEFNTSKSTCVQTEKHE